MTRLHGEERTKRPATTDTAAAQPGRAADDSTARRRVVIESMTPLVDCGRFPIKHTIGESVTVELDAFTDGHDAIACVLLHRKVGASLWIETRMEPLGNDRWRASFPVTELGRYEYTAIAWVDHFESWRRDLKKKVSAGQNVETDLEIGAALVRDAAERNTDEPARQLATEAKSLTDTTKPIDARVKAALNEELEALMQEHAPRWHVSAAPHTLQVAVDPVHARFSTWYEMFPRSCTDDPNQHGTFRDCIERLPYIAGMGFDVLYLPPIHPIGRTHRKGKNNARTAQPADVGSPWAIGAEEGGHKSIHPELGTFEDFAALTKAAKDHGLRIALDIAFQCSPDHPYVKEHPEWFKHRPDGSIQYAENPPKKYEDIYPFDFATDAWESLWHELKSIFDFWIERGVTIFRVDNPHTKSFAFWEWAIDDIKRRHPEVVFLAEAFTRPKVMKRLAKLGFTQSYTYFAWKNTKHELEEYFTELAQTSMREYYRPNAWPNTPDILNAYLQHGGRSAFMTRLALAATLTANYGIYGPAFELVEHSPREPGSEEYLHSEKYQIRFWDIERQDSLRHFLPRVNRIRHENPALQSDWSLHFHQTDNDLLICYSKATSDLENIIISVINLDPHHTQSGWVTLDLTEFGLKEDATYQVHDLINDDRYIWDGRRNYVELNPPTCPAHIFRLRRHVRTEEDFEYFL